MKTLLFILLCLCTAAVRSPTYTAKLTAQRLAKAPRQAATLDKAMAVVTAQPPSPFQPHLQMSWGAVSPVSFYRVYLSVNGSLVRGYDTTNTTLTVAVPGGFNYTAYVQGIIKPGNYKAVGLMHGPCSAPAAVTAILPTNAPQLLVLKTNWLVAALAAGSSTLKTSTDLRKWVAVGGLASNQPSVFQGLTKSVQFFSITTP